MELVVTVLGAVFGVVGMVGGLVALVDRHDSRSRGGVRHVMVRRRPVTPGTTEIVISNHGPLPVTVAELWFAPSPGATSFYPDGSTELVEVSDLDIKQPLLPSTFTMALDGRDLAIPPGGELVVPTSDLHYFVDHTDEAATLRLHGVRYGGTGWEPWLQIVDYNGHRWVKYGTQFWKSNTFHYGEPGSLRDRWIGLIQRAPCYPALDHLLFRWAVRGLRRNSAAGDRRARFTAWITGWPAGRGVDLQRYPYLPAVWQWGELIEAAHWDDPKTQSPTGEVKQASTPPWVRHRLTSHIASPDGQDCDRPPR